ncbi:phenylalanyl-tRNA synthetase subunit beta [Dinoroseobacter sp. S375]|uniref:phenylalanyl-tRNA synthetase subunit beta n=1 Tax=Dinoroseobacter sp. S375 TaxID=3415136 RepID=UPI003C7B499C
MATRLALGALITLIILAHIGLWTSDRWPVGLKLRLTLLNALGWAVILLPAYGVSRWFAARERREERDP